MAHTSVISSELRIASLVEALTITGPVKPLLMFARIAREGLGNHPKVSSTLLTTRRSSGGPDPLGEAARAAGMRYVTLPERKAFDTGVLRSLKQTVREAMPHIIETHDCKSHFLFFLARMQAPDLRKIRWIAYHHGYTKTSWKVSLYQNLDRLTLRFPDRVITLCQPFARTLEKHGVPPGKLRVISNAIDPPTRPDTAAIQAFRSSHGIGVDEVVIVTVGRLSVEKAQGDLLAAFAQAKNDLGGVRARLIIVGDGPEREALRQIAAPLADSVLFLGHLPDPSIAFYAADVFALTSHSEGSPLVLFEAMAAANAILATSVGGVPETVTHGESALLVEPCNVGEIAGALRTLIVDPALRRKLATGASAALTNFTPSAYAEKLFRIYDQTLAI